MATLELLGRGWLEASAERAFVGDRDGGGEGGVAGSPGSDKDRSLGAGSPGGDRDRGLGAGCGGESGWDGELR